MWEWGESKSFDVTTGSTQTMPSSHALNFCLGRTLVRVCDHGVAWWWKSVISKHNSYIVHSLDWDAFDHASHVRGSQSVQILYATLLRLLTTADLKRGLQQQKCLLSPRTTTNQSEGYSIKRLIWLVCREPLHVHYIPWQGLAEAVHLGTSSVLHQWPCEHYAWHLTTLCPWAGRAALNSA